MAEVVLSSLVGSLVQSALTPKPPPPPQVQTLTREEATQMAQEALNPLFDEQLQNTLRQVDLHNIRRGFFGQVPGAALSGARAADVERSRAAATANLAQQMFGQSQQAALQAAALAQQQWQNQAQNVFRGIGTGLAGAQLSAELTGMVPFSGGQFTFPIQMGLTNMGVQNALGQGPQPAPTGGRFTLQSPAISRSNLNWINPF